MSIPTNEEIEMMKNNREALCFWPEKLQKWARENRKHIITIKRGHSSNAGQSTVLGRRLKRRMK